MSWTGRSNQYNSGSDDNSQTPRPSAAQLHSEAEDRRMLLFSPITGPIGDTHNPDNLLREVPNVDVGAVSDFNSANSNSPPHRFIPSDIIAHLQSPNVHEQEPDWARRMTFFTSPHANHGRENLEDLYVFVVRVMLPNVIIRNRRAILRMFLARPDLPPNMRVRYDAWQFSNLGNTIPGDIDPLPDQIPRMTRSIYTSRLTPNGALFMNWLGTTLTVPQGVQYPTQMTHRRGEIDNYLADDESRIRGLTTDRLMRRVTRVLHIFWWIATNNAGLVWYHDRNWDGIEAMILPVANRPQ